MCCGHAEIEVLAAVGMKNTVSWDVMLYGLTEVYQHGGGTNCFMLHDGRNRGSRFLQNVIKLLPDSTGGASRAARAGQILNEILDKALQVWGWAWG
jgi:hypothetical protein